MIAVVGKWTAEINLIFKEINTIIFYFVGGFCCFLSTDKRLQAIPLFFFFLKNKLQLVT